MPIGLWTARLCIAATVLAAAAASAQMAPSSTAIDSGATVPRPGERPELSVEQKSAIYRAVRQDRTKVARAAFPARVGADVPPSLELYTLPDDTIAQAPVTRLFRVVVVGETVVLVDPTTMRVVEVIDR